MRKTATYLSTMTVCACRPCSHCTLSLWWVSVSFTGVNLRKSSSRHDRYPTALLAALHDTSHTLINFFALSSLQNSNSLVSGYLQSRHASDSMFPYHPMMHHEPHNVRNNKYSRVLIFIWKGLNALALILSSEQLLAVASQSYIIRNVTRVRQSAYAIIWRRHKVPPSCH